MTVQWWLEVVAGIAIGTPVGAAMGMAVAAWLTQQHERRQHDKHANALKAQLAEAKTQARLAQAEVAQYRRMSAGVTQLTKAVSGIAHAVTHR